MLGTAFARLPDPDGLGAHLAAAVTARDAASREAALASAYETLARRHGAASLTEPVDPTTRPFHGRPFRVLGADRFVDACLATVTDPDLAGLPLVGGVDQAVDSTDVLSDPAVVARLRALWVG